MKTIFKKYSLPLVVLVIIGIMVMAVPMIGNTFFVQSQNEVIGYNDHECEMIAGESFNSIISDQVISVIFTCEKAPADAALIDVSVMKDGSVVAWLDGTTFMVSTQDSEKQIFANNDCSKMFYNKKNLVYVDFENFNTCNVTNMYGMFANCSSLTKLNSSNFDTRGADNMCYMFQNCKDLSVNCLSWDVTKVKGNHLHFSDNAKNVVQPTWIN